MIAKPIKVKALKKHTIFVEFSDGTRGAVDLAHLAHKGVFRDYKKDNLFMTSFAQIPWEVAA